MLQLGSACLSSGQLPGYLGGSLILPLALPSPTHEENIDSNVIKRLLNRIIAQISIHKHVCIIYFEISFGLIMSNFLTFLDLQNLAAPRL